MLTSPAGVVSRPGSFAEYPPGGGASALKNRGVSEGVINRLLSARSISKTFLTGSFSVAEVRQMHSALWGKPASTDVPKNVRPSSGKRLPARHLHDYCEHGSMANAPELICKVLAFSLALSSKSS